MTMIHICPVGDWHKRLPVLISKAQDGDTIVVPNQIALKVAQLSIKHIWTDKKVTFSLAITASE